MKHGVLVIDKPEGISSGFLARRIQKKLNLKKGGHGGTLDPLATGVLLVCVNEATKIAGYLQNSDKVYEGTMLLGRETDSYDITGQILNEEKPVVTDGDIRRAFDKHTGALQQLPPMFSAIKKKGKPLYVYARKQQTVEREPRAVRIDEFRMIERRGCEVDFHVRCSKGTYIRSLCHDVGIALGTHACLKALRRVASGGFTVDQAISADKVNANNAFESPHWVSLSELFLKWGPVTLTPELAKRVRTGYAPSFEEVLGDEVSGVASFEQKEWVCLMDDKQTAVALAKPQKDAQLLKLIRVFNC